MSTRPSNTVVADVARALVAQVAPQELPLFRTLSAAYFANPDKPIKFEGSKDNPLGFGQGGNISVATPAILAASSVVVSYVVGATQTTGMDAGAAQSLFAKVGSDEAQQASAKVLVAAETDRVRLRTLLDDLFSLDDFKQLCFDLGIDFDNLSGETKKIKTQSLIIFCEQRGRMDDLIRRAQAINPNMPWPAQGADVNRLSTAQLAHVFQVALNTLTKSMPSAQAAQIAAAFVGSLAAGPAGAAI